MTKTQKQVTRVLKFRSKTVFGKLKNAAARISAMLCGQSQYRPFTLEVQTSIALILGEVYWDLARSGGKANTPPAEALSAITLVAHALLPDPHAMNLFHEYKATAHIQPIRRM